MNLRFRIAESLPSDSVSLRALLLIASIEEDASVPTACVTFGAAPRLLINPDFVARHAQTPAKLQALIGHELLHVALGHTRRYAQCTPMDNLVVDCLINATLCKADPTPERTALFRDFYSERSFPQCFLRPPDDWHPRLRVRLPSALKAADFQGLAFVKDVYRKLWGLQGASTWEIREAIRVGAKGLGITPDMLVEVNLLGGHDQQQGELGAGELERDFVQGLVNEYSKKLGAMGVEPGVPPQEMLAQSQIIPPKISARVKLRKLFACLAHGKESAQIGRPSEHSVGVITPTPARDRRAIVQRSLGLAPMLYETPVSKPAPRASERIHVYLDVSGSMNDVLAPLYGAIVDCTDWVDEHIHLFSTQVEDISLAGLKAGQVKSTGGTSIECVASHIRTHRIRRALVLTDGFVGKPSLQSREVLSRVKLAVGWVGSQVREADLAPYTVMNARVSV
jgi:hypothetical protein